jgi:secondary thiamine-phosphate synthase enzyme
LHDATPIQHPLAQHHSTISSRLKDLKRISNDITNSIRHDNWMPTSRTKSDSHHVVGYPSSLSSTILFLFILLLCFFPSAFLPLIYAPLSIVSALGSSYSSKAPSAPAVPSHLPQTSQPEPSTMSSSSWFQKTLQLPAKARGSYLITDTIVNQLPELRQYKVGILHLFAMHTSCALSMNENWDSDVREDMSDAMDRIVPENVKGGYRHSAEGSDDMPVSVMRQVMR